MSVSSDRSHLPEFPKCVRELRTISSYCSEGSSVGLLPISMTELVSGAVQKLAYTES